MSTHTSLITVRSGLTQLHDSLHADFDKGQLSFEDYDAALRHLKQASLSVAAMEKLHNDSFNRPFAGLFRGR